MTSSTDDEALSDRHESLKNKIEQQKIAEELRYQETLEANLQNELKSCAQLHNSAKAEKQATNQILLDLELKISKYEGNLESAEAQAAMAEARAKNVHQYYLEQIKEIENLEEEYKQTHESAMETDRVADIARQRCRRSKELHEAEEWKP
jgi:hypothetical protein